MRFMVMIKSTKDSEAGIPPSPQLIAEMGKLSETLVKAGVMLASGGLQPSSSGVRIRYADGKRSVTDGPFIEVKELIGGYAIVQAGSKEEAIELANRVVDIHVDAGVAELEMEIRPMFDPDCGTAQ
ncbi:MAG TPA: YciI family protein [Casimicrobiaceae bacterium]|jgi:hypothetical protein